MMSWLRKIAGICVLICALGAVAASSASAAGVLEINKEGVPAAQGTTAYADVYIGSCYIDTPGEITTNGKAKDKAIFEDAPVRTCYGGNPIFGGITQLQASAGGAVTMKASPKLRLEYDGPCRYEYSKLSGTIKIPGELVFKGIAMGVLNAKKSNPNCEKMYNINFEADLAVELEGSPFTTELRR